MWNWFNCYLSGRHEYGPWCEPGSIFLRCVHCGRRSPGWAIGPEPRTAPKITAAVAKVAAAASTSAAPVLNQTQASRVLPFGRVAAR